MKVGNSWDCGESSALEKHIIAHKERSTYGSRSPSGLSNNGPNRWLRLLTRELMRHREAGQLVSTWLELAPFSWWYSYKNFFLSFTWR